MAYLSDKNGYVARILKGFGYVMPAYPLPYPMSGYANPAAPSYDFNPTTAQTAFDNRGFTATSGVSNPCYDSGETWFQQYLRIDPRTGSTLDPLEFYIRLDEPFRLAVGEELRDIMRKSGIQVKAHIVESAVSYENVMLVYDYHIYTGNWGGDFELGSSPDFLYYLYHSSMYYGGSDTSYFGGIDSSFNYIGFANYEFDYCVEMVKYFWADRSELKLNVQEAEEIFAQYVPTIPLCSSGGVNAWRHNVGPDGIYDAQRACMHDVDTS